jgi:hypothetical protein
VSVSSTLTTSSLGGMVQWGLDDGRAMMDLCRAVASSDTVVALMAGLVRGFTSVFHSRDGLAEGGGGDLWILRIRRFIWIVLRSRRWWWVRHKTLSNPLACVLVWWFFDTFFGVFGLYDRCKVSSQSFLNK